MRGSVITFSVLALVGPAVGLLLLLIGVASSLCYANCGGGGFLAIGGCLAGLGMLCWILAVLLAGTLAGQANDRLGQAAILITAGSPIAGLMYVNYAISRTGPGHVGLNGAEIIRGIFGLLFPVSVILLPALLLTRYSLCCMRCWRTIACPAES
jgi:hypothetical protein